MAAEFSPYWNRRNRPRPPRTPGWFKAWFVFSAVAGVVTLGVVFWAVIKIVNYATSPHCG